jgi:hypothetical protein
MKINQGSQVYNSHINPKKKREGADKIILFEDLKKYFGAENVVREHLFHATRKWRFDFAVPTRMLAFEINGGIFMRGGAHSLPTNILRDMVKANQATLLGWDIFHFYPKEIELGLHLEYLRALKGRDDEKSFRVSVDAAGTICGPIA